MRQLAGEAESAGLLSCVRPEASPWGSSPAPGSELSSAAGVGHGVGLRTYVLKRNMVKKKTLEKTKEGSIVGDTSNLTKLQVGKR